LVSIHMFFGILKLIRMFKISKFQNGRRKRPSSKMAATFMFF